MVQCFRMRRGAICALAHDFFSEEKRADWRLLAAICVGGREIDGDALAVGKFDAAIAKSGFDAFAAFFYGIVGQTDDIEVVHASGADVDFHFDKVSGDAKHGGTDSLEKP